MSTTLVRVICVGDLHFKCNNITEVELFTSKFLSFLRNEVVEEKVEEEKEDEEEEQKVEYEEEEKVEQKEDVQTICIILGDILDTFERLHTIPMNMAYNFIEKVAKIVETYIIVGNHDMLANSEYLTPHHWMNAMKKWNNVTIVDRVAKRRIGDFLFTLCPYVYPGRFIEALNEDETDEEDGPNHWSNSSCIFAHQEFFGCKMGAIVSADGDKWPLDYPYVVSGHIHSNQTPQRNVYYPGSALQHSFGESNRNIIAILEFPNNESNQERKDNCPYNLIEHDLGLPRKRIVYLPVEDVLSYELPEEKDEKDEGEEEKKGKDQIKLTVSGSYTEFKSLKKTKKYKELLSSGVKIVFKPKKRVERKREGRGDEEKKGGGEEKEDREERDENNFLEILHNLITSSKDKYLSDVYNIVFRNR